MHLKAFFVVVFLFLVFPIRCPMDTCSVHVDKSVIAPGSLLSGLDDNEQDLIETLVTAKQKVRVETIRFAHSI